MSSALTHDEVFEQLPDLALGLVPPAAAAALEGHVATCARCQAELRTLHAAAASLAPPPQGVLEAPRRAAVREGLVARARASAAATPAATPVGPTLTASTSASRPMAKPRRTFAQRLANEWFPLVTAAGLLFGLRVGFVMMKERDQARSAATAASARISALQDSLGQRDAMLADLTGAAVRVVDLAANGTPQAGAKMFWDRASNRWTLITHHLQPPAAGRTYQLWLVTTAGTKVSAGTFTPDAKGTAIVRATYVLGAGDLAAIAISVEPTGGSAQPTGEIVLASGA